MDELAKKRCVPCEEGGEALTFPQAKDLMEHVPGWTLSDDAKKLYRGFTFKDFKTALAFANEVGKLAEEDWHHPDLMVSWGTVGIELSTHAVKGLSENDFILAAKINEIPQ